MPKNSLRKKILTAVAGLATVSLLGFVYNLYHIHRVNQRLESINAVWVPLGKLSSQLKSDAEILRREMERRLGYSHWRDPHWKPQNIPPWLAEVLQNQVNRLETLFGDATLWLREDNYEKWSKWFGNVRSLQEKVMTQSASLHEALRTGNETQAFSIYPQWIVAMDDWVRQLKWAGTESERDLREAFASVDRYVGDLQWGLEVILLIVGVLSLSLFWFGERTLRPLIELRKLVSAIATRGLKKEDRAIVPSPPLSKSDEVSELAREFHRMTTVLLEGEKMVEEQNHRLKEKNRLLEEMGSLNATILNSFQSALFVIDSQGLITHANQAATVWCGEISPLSGTPIANYLQDWPSLIEIVRSGKSGHLELKERGQRFFSGHVFPLATGSGAVILIEDLTPMVEMQRKLHTAENLAAVGRMSAQVAHEVRNPLHSIGLEAEMAYALAQKISQPELSFSLQSILKSVDRLERMTETYLRLSRLSSSRKESINMSEVLENILADFSPIIQSKQIRMEWSRSSREPLWVYGDRLLLEQAVGNLLSNAIQSVELRSIDSAERRVEVELFGEEEKIVLAIRDFGMGIDPIVRDRLFQPFVTTKAQGTGLGLPFVKQIVEEHSGEIIFDANIKDGARFVLTLPKEKRCESTSSMTMLNP